MELTLGLALIWIFSLVKGSQNEQSLSFSSPLNAFTERTSSFWHGTIPSTLLNEDLQFKLYLNKLEGLIFYAIDHLYQSIWIEFDKVLKTKFIISYYNFKTDMIDPIELDAITLCSLREVEDVTLNLKVSLVNNAVMLECNGNDQRVFYSPNTNLVNDNSLARFLYEMKNPVPVFNNTDINNGSSTYVWIGNTPSVRSVSFRNVKVESQKENLVGCVQSVLSGNTPIEVSTSGRREGNMVEPFCAPVCGTNPCHNKARCVERWRHNFKCQCGLSNFIGKYCNTTYAVEFDGQRSVDIPIQQRLDRYQIAFNHIKTYRAFEAFKIFSIQFVFNRSLYLYIDAKGLLQMRFTLENSHIIEETFRGQIENNKTYILIIDAGIGKINFQLVDSFYRYVIESKTISRSLPSLITMNISVGDSHLHEMRWMTKFKGCISNIILATGKRTFIWNTIENFDQLPSCDRKVRNVPLIMKTVTQSTVNDASEASNALSPVGLTHKADATYITIFIIVPIFIIIAIMLISVFFYRHARLKKGSFAEKRLISNNEKVLSFETVTYQHGSVPNSPPIHYKPPYKARSISYSSNIGKSITSLPPPTTPTLVTPEDGDW